MATEDFKRKLTAILSADVEGYSRLMGEDEEATVRAITAYREVIVTVVEKHRGRVVDSPGDNILAEFASVVDAVRGGVDIQEELKIRNAELPENRRMEFRIGINLGDVIQEGDRIYGDGVNVAARVESLADAGGICVSRTAFDHIENKLPLGYEYLGEQSVKNIKKPVRVYRVLVDPDAVGKVIGEERVKPWKGQRLALALVIVLLLILGGLVIWRAASPPLEVASVEKMAFPLPDKPSLAVLPFENMSGDPKQEYFSDGLTEDMITDLSKISGLFVIARNSTFTYKGKPVKVQQIAEDLGVRYVLEGSVRRAADKVRINAQLIDATTGHHLWAERFDGKWGDIFSLQDAFTQKIVSALAVQLTTDDQSLLASKETKNVEAYDAYLQGTDYYQRMTRDDLVKAVEYYKKAIELDPNYGRAHGALSMVYGTIINRGWAEDLGWSNARALAKKHQEGAMRNPTATAYRAAAKSLMWQKKYDESIAAAERSLAMEPNSTHSHYHMARTLIYAGRSEEAVGHMKMAMRLDPQYPAYYLWHLGMARFCMGQMEEAVTLFERTQKRHPKTSVYALAATYAYLGHEQEAKDLVTEYIKRRGFKNPSVKKLMRYYPFRDPEDADRFAKGVHMAGLPME
jgi:TolB-like protein/class 3 adenylate cyclase/Flp pilus assembly protein TadD